MGHTTFVDPTIYVYTAVYVCCLMQECNGTSLTHDKLLPCLTFRSCSPTAVLANNLQYPTSAKGKKVYIGSLRTIIKPGVFIWLFISTGYSTNKQELTLVASSQAEATSVSAGHTLSWLSRRWIYTAATGVPGWAKGVVPAFKTREKYIPFVLGQNYCILVSLIIREGYILLFLRIVRKNKYW